MDKSSGAKSLDKYERLCLIGEGSFGKVFKAKHLELQKTVALKIISKSGRSGKELSSLKHECEIQKHLAHPNIIKFIESHETAHEFVLITEFAHMSLSQLLEQKKRLSEINCVQILTNLISALYYLHSNRVLHRDLKPQNVLLNKAGIAMLCDFGFARSMAAGTHVLTSIKGTPLYMAPELIAERPYDHTADLWSLGCIAYEIHIGQPPFKTMSILHLIRLLKTREVTFPQDVSPEYKDLVQGLLEKDASQRLSWPELLYHPLVQDSLSIELEDNQTHTPGLASPSLQ
uniref:non-specific serine/threonine protein kinase n=1 Tax=Cacopsylla melanoneura TaxID=428564 RepID=A0A8D8SF66_9HEMI